MQLIKDKQITDDTWQFIADDAELTSGKITVSASRLDTSFAELVNLADAFGVRLFPGDAVETIVGYLPKLALIELYFPDMNDGRLFSFAWTLRNRHAYPGEIRAVGHFLPEQAFYLSRVGVNSFIPAKPDDLAVTLTNLQDFSVKYQPSVN